MAESSLYFKQIEIGPMQNFTYLIGDPVSREALVVDAAWDIPTLIRIAGQDGFTITKALVTHYHQDHLGGDFGGYHIQGAAELLEQVKARVYIHKAEAGFLGRLAGLSLEESLCTDTASSGYYVRNAASPTLEELADFLDALPAPERA